MCIALDLELPGSKECKIGCGRVDMWDLTEFAICRG